MKAILELTIRGKWICLEEIKKYHYLQKQREGLL